ncbi:hypothetical protein DFH06DRAFT_1128101 [Mycena polygramma]|nr:hypothetical protein DFH06DRAFT_1128101 [Mycena polygramma]
MRRIPQKMHAESVPDRRSRTESPSPRSGAPSLLKASLGPERKSALDHLRSIRDWPDVPTPEETRVQIPPKALGLGAMSLPFWFGLWLWKILNGMDSHLEYFIRPPPSPLRESNPENPLLDLFGEDAAKEPRNIRAARAVGARFETTSYTRRKAPSRLSEFKGLCMGSLECSCVSEYSTGKPDYEWFSEAKKSQAQSMWPKCGQGVFFLRGEAAGCRVRGLRKNVENEAASLNIAALRRPEQQNIDIVTDMRAPAQGTSAGKSHGAQFAGRLDEAENQE